MLRACLAALLCVSTEAHIMTVCSSQSEAQPGFVTLWFATYHSYTETDRTSVLKVVDPESGAHLSTTDFQSCRATNNNRNVDDIADVLQSSCSHISLYLDGAYRQAFPNSSSVACYQSGTTARLGEIRVGDDSLEVCYTASNFNSWHAAIVKADNVGEHEVWIDGSPNTSASPLSATGKSHESHMPCAMSSSVHWILPFVDQSTSCSSPPAHLLDHVVDHNCSNSYAGQICSVECEPGYATQGVLQCERANSSSETGEGEWSSSSFACVPYASDAPTTRAPGVNYVCDEHNDLGDTETGNVSFQNYERYHTECWHIECDKDVVISFSTMQLYSYSYLYLYTGKDSGNGTDFTLEKRFSSRDSPIDIVLNGSAYVQFRGAYLSGWSKLEFNYVCVAATTPAPPTDAPTTRAPGVNYVCEEHNDLGNNETGHVSFVNYDSYHTECWHIECDKDVVISFSTMQMYYSTSLDLYTGNVTVNGTEFTLEKGFEHNDSPMDVVLGGSAYVQFNSNSSSGLSRIEFDYVCVDATSPAPSTDVPVTRAPGVNYPCEEHNDLGNNETGNVSFQNYDRYHTECWHIECDKDVVISFSTMQMYYSTYLYLYTGNVTGNGTDFTMEKSFNSYASPMDVVLNGSAFVQFRSTWYGGWSKLEFDYVCVDANSPAPPTDVPVTRAPGVNYPCEEHNDLGDAAAGNVSFQNYDSYHTECWHIECDKDVVISFSTMQMYSGTNLYLYTGKDSGNDTHFTFEKRFAPHLSAVDVVLSGSAFVQFRSTYYNGWSKLDFNYVCVDAITDAPPTAAPRTPAPGVNYPCEEHNDLGDAAVGKVTFQNDENYHTECWHIECDKDVVISFSNLQLFASCFLDLYTGEESGNGTDFTLKKSFDRYDSPVDVVLGGSAYVQFRSNYYSGWSRLEFDYVCVDRTTEAPSTRAPGVSYICEEHNDLGDTETGNVSFQNYDSYHTECWHIECDKDVVISFSTMQMYSGTYLYLYTGKDSGNDKHFTFEKRFASWDSAMDVVLSGSAFVQFKSNYPSGWSRLDFNYVCVDATTQAPPTDVPPTRAPGVNYPCEEHNDLGDSETGNVSFQNYYYRTECWHIECDKDVVISFSTMQLSYTATLDLYTGEESGKETHFTLEKSFSSYDYRPVDVVLHGSAFVQFRSVSYWGWSRLDFNYVCVDATTPAPPTDAPTTRAPGVTYVCEEHNDLGDNETGHVSFVKYGSYHTECWHIECDKDVVISFSNLQLYYYSYLYLYTGNESENGTDFDLRRVYQYGQGTPHYDIVLSGPAFVQFRSTSYSGLSRLSFDYVCVDATTESPSTSTDVPNTRAPGVSYICEEHNDLGDTETGIVSFQNYDSYHTECWHIECDKDVVISFSTMQMYSGTYLYLYTGKDSGNDKHFTFEKRFASWDSAMDVVLSGSAFVQFKSNYPSGWSRLDFNYVCVDATTQAPPTDVPPTRAPGVNYPCEEHNDLGDSETGNVSFQNYYYRTECWHIECDKDVVISFSTMQLSYTATLDLYTGEESGKETHFTLEKSFSSYDYRPVDVVLHGSAFVQFRSVSYWGWSRLDFNYVCVDATTPAPPTDVPDTRAPGVTYVCEEHNDLGDNETGHVSFVKYGSYHTECWHIECDKDVVISFSNLQLYYYSYLYLYTGNESGNGTDFDLRRVYQYGQGTPDYDIVLSGPAFVQFRSTSYSGLSRLSFDYVCVDATTEAPPTDAPTTRAPGVQHVCEDHNDLGDNETGNVSFQNYDNYHTECWHIECDKDVVISFSTMQLYYYSYLYLYTGNESGNGTDFDLRRVYRYTDGTPDYDIVLHGSAFVQFRSTYYNGWSRLSFNYVCVDATTEAPPTDVPTTRAPGVQHVCEDHNDRTGTGYENLENTRSYYTHCWHIECDYDVVLKFSDLELYYYSYVSIYSSEYGSGNDTDFNLEHEWSSRTSGVEGVEIVVRGSAFVQFRSTYYNGRSYLAFQYECRAPTPPPQPHCGVADTVPQRCGRGTSRACAFEVRHPAGLLSVAFSWDGRRVATGSADRFVRVFDARTGVRVGQLGCADGFRVHDIAFSPDNNLVALAGEGGRVVVCDAATGVLEATLVDMSASGSTPVHRVEFTKDGRYVVSGGGHDARTRVFDMHSSDKTKASSVINHHARNVGFSVDGAHLATVRGSEVDEVTTVWRLDGVASAVELPSVSARVTALSFSSFGGNALLRGMSDGTILVSQLPGSSIGDGSAVDGVSLSMLSGAVHDSKFSRDGKMIAAVGEGDVTVWSHDGSVLHELLGHSQAVLPRLDFSPDGTRLATVSRDGTLVVWKL